VGVGKRTLRVSRKELEQMFGLPEGVEILAVRASKGYSDEQDFEFLLASAGEVEVNGFKVTVEQRDGDFGLTRSIGLQTLRRIENGEEPYATGGYVNGNLPPINVHIEKTQGDADKISKEIMKGLKNIMDKDSRKDGK
jgi:hypothetical protein